MLMNYSHRRLMCLAWILLFFHGTIVANSHLRTFNTKRTHHKFGAKLNESRLLNRSIWRTNQLKHQIKIVLNLDLLMNNDTIDRYIIDTFNIRNVDPIYLFALPDSNETLQLRRSNFSEITFPNTTALQMLQKIIKTTQLNQLLPMAKNLPFADRTFTSKFREFMSGENDLFEAESRKIIDENVRTERNFFHFMDKLNEENDIDVNGERTIAKDQNNHWPLLRHLHTNDKNNNFNLAKNQKRTPAKLLNRPATWDDFELHGWIGSIDTKPQNPQENGMPMRVEWINSGTKQTLFPKKFIPILVNYDPLALITTTSMPSSTKQFEFDGERNRLHARPKLPSIILSTLQTTTQSNVSPFQLHRKPFKLHEPIDQSDEINNWDVKWNISNELRDLLETEKMQLQSISHEINANNKFKATKSRSQHRDHDIFVGRANNPFGHSTKWKLSVMNEDIDSNDLEDDGRQKRDVIDLYSMVKCATGCDPLIYKGYGCYCGFLGNGETLDGIDRCCKMHDYCYQVANCPKFLEYFVPYLWKCYRGRPLCAIDHGEWGGPNSCAATLCECDRALSNCLRRFYCPHKRAVCTSSPLRLLQNLLMDL